MKKTSRIQQTIDWAVHFQKWAKKTPQTKPDKAGRITTSEKKSLHSVPPQLLWLYMMGYSHVCYTQRKWSLDSGSLQCLGVKLACAGHSRFSWRTAGAVPFPLRRAPRPLKPRPLTNHPGTPKVSRLRFRSSAHVSLKTLDTDRHAVDTAETRVWILKDKMAADLPETGCSEVVKERLGFVVVGLCFKRKNWRQLHFIFFVLCVFFPICRDYTRNYIRNVEGRAGLKGNSPFWNSYSEFLCSIIYHESSNYVRIEIFEQTI